jgi:ABC-type multidrug transport system ATPase subunit
MQEVRQLSKRDGDTIALCVPGGEVFFLLGPKGAGETTTVNLFFNFIAPTTSGSAFA